MATKRERAKPGRPLKPLITREAAIAAAIELADTDGLEKLSVQAVARRMNVTAPSLYHHFSDKDELLECVALELLHQVGEGHHSDAAWADRIIELSVATRRVILRHANAAPLMLRFFPRKLMLRAYERTLADCPYDAKYHMVILEAVEKLTYGSSLFAASAETYHSPAIPAFDAERYPLLAHAMAAAPKDDETIFVESLNALLDGFAARFGKSA